MMCIIMMTPHDRSIVQDLGFQYYFANRWLVVRLISHIENLVEPKDSELFKPECWTGSNWNWFFHQFDVKVIL